MSEAPPDFKVLARRYLDLWQDQMAALGNDPVLAESVAKGIAMMTQMPAAFAQAANGAPKDKAGHAAQPSSSSPSAEPASREPAAEPGGPPPVAAAPDGARLDLDGLQARLAALEERVAVLESRLVQQGAGPEGKPRKRRPRRLERL